MFIQKMVLTVKGNEDRLHRFECDPAAPLGEVHDALVTMTNFTLEEIKKHAKPLDEDGENKEECESQEECENKEECNKQEESEEKQECDSDFSEQT